MFSREIFSKSFYVLFRKNNQGNKLELKQDLKEMTSEIAIKMMAQQGELKEHLAKQIGQNNEKMLTGRTDTNKVIIFEGEKDLIGRTIEIKIVSEHKWYLKGEI